MAAEGSYDVPNVFGRITELATGDTGAKAEVADTDGVVLEFICEIIVALGHCTNENTYALFGPKIGYVILHSDNRSIKTESDFSTIWRQMVGYRVLNDLEKLFL